MILLPVFLLVAVPAWIWMLLNALKADRLAGALKAAGLSLRRGLPLEEALAAVAEETGGKTRRRCRQGAERAAAGGSAAEALEGLLGLLPKDLGCAVDSSAPPARLASALESSADLLAQRLERRRELAMALLYPGALGLLLAAGGGFLAEFILPQFHQMLAEFGVPPERAAGLARAGDASLGLLLLGLLSTAALVVAGALWPRRAQTPWGFLAGQAAAALRDGGDLIGRLTELAERAPWPGIRAACAGIASGLRAGGSLPDLLASERAPALLGFYARLGARAGEPAAALQQAADLIETAGRRRRLLARAAAPLVLVVEGALLGLIAWTLFSAFIAVMDLALSW